MNRSEPQLDAWLTELGKARTGGLLNQPAARAALPWQVAASASPATTATIRHGSARRAFWGMAAAACVGLVLVGIWRVEPLWTAAPQAAAPTPTLALASRDAGVVQPVESTPIAAANVQSLPGDYNGDGHVDGEDIQFFLNQQAQKPKSDVNASDFARKLLGS